MVTEQIEEEYTVCVPVQSMRECQVRVCHQVCVTVDCCGNVVEAAAPAEAAVPAVEEVPAATAEEAPVAPVADEAANEA
jgi:hypothetical protein